MNSVDQHKEEGGSMHSSVRWESSRKQQRRPALLFLCLIVSLGIVLAACGSSTTSSSSSSSASNNSALKAVLAASPKGFHLANYIRQAILHHSKLTIYLDYYAPTVAFAAPLREGVAKAAKVFGVNASVVGPSSGTASGQVSQLQTLITQGQVDGIAVTAASDSALNPIIATAYSDGIPVISVNSNDPGSKQMAYVGQQLVPSGFAAGKELLSLLHGRRGKVVVFSIETGAGWSHERMTGFMDAVRGHGLDVVGPVNTGQDPTTGYSVVSSTIEGNPNARAYISLDCCSLDLIGKWVQLNHPSPKPIVVGFDILAPTKQYIEQGVISATVTQDAPLQGYDAIADIANYLLHGVRLHNINTGEHLVTKSNANTTAAT